jgi:flagellar hook-associated protein FlgK
MGKHSREAVAATKVPSLLDEIKVLRQQIELKNKQIDDLKKAAEMVEKTKNGAYSERNQLVVLLSKIFDAHLAKHPDSDKNWERDWMNIVCIHFPTGQGAWHIHDSELSLFKHLEVKPNDWDNHTTEEKYKRIAQIPKLSDINIEDLSIFYHNVASKELVVNNTKNLITKPTTPFIEWKDLTDEQKDGRRIMMGCLLKEYRIVKR